MSNNSMTSEPTTQNHIQQTLFAEVFPAKIYQLQAYKQASRKKPDQVSFLNSCESFAWLDPNTLSWKTWQRSLITDWTSFSESFPKQGTMQNGQLYQQVLWEPVTRDQDGGLLPTPTRQDFKRRGPNSKQQGLSNTENWAMLPTPLASVGNRKAKFAQGGTPLRGALKFQSLPTPSAHEHKYSMSKEDHQSGTCLAALARKDRLSTPTGNPMSLNPAFVEEMMGYPIGHTDLKH